MKTSKVLLAGIVIILAGAIIWYVGFSGKITDLSSYSTVNANPAASQDQADTNAPGQADPNGATPSSDSNEPNKAPAPEPTSPKPNSPQEAANESGKKTDSESEVTADPKAKPGEAKKAGDPNTPEDPNAPKKPKVQMEALNLKDVQMKDIVKKITEWTDKVVIPMGEAMNQKITIFSPKEVTRTRALSLIYAALRTKGYTAEEDGDVIYLKPLADAKLGKVPVIGPNEPLAQYENKEQVVQKFFKLENYNPEDMVEMIRPFIAEYGMVTSDAATSTVSAIETINNLMRIAMVIEQFDVPDAEQAVSELIPIRNGDPAEVVQLLRILLDSSEANSSRRPSSRYSSYRDTTISTVVAGQGKMPIILIPQSKNKVIIVRASAADMKNVKEWIEKLDLSDPGQSEYETVPVIYANPREVARAIEEAIRGMPGSELRPSVLVRPLDQSRQIMIFGREDMRNAVKELIKEVDMPSGVFEQKSFDLTYVDPDQVRENIENLYETDSQNSGDYYSYMRRMRSNTNPTDIVKVIPLSTMQRVTVIASPENMRKIEEQIKEWDTPLDVDQVKPRIISLRNSDPVQMAQLLSKLFSEEDDSSSQFIRMIFNGDSQMKKKIIGPLYGLLTFEAVPGTKKIIVISKVPEAYQVIEDLISELDGQEMAEVPEVIQLNYADPEGLAERLNALFNESGTNARIRFSEQGLNSNPDPPGGNNNNNNNNNRTQNNNANQNTGFFEGYWNQQRTRTDEEPISNVIGQVRFIPDTHSKSLLVLAAPEFMDSIKKMIQDLDVPGKQVLIKAIVLEVDHSSMTSLGVQLSSNSASFGEIGENAVNALTKLQFLETRGSGSIDSGANIYALIDFLEKNVNAKILNQQSLWTKDNEMATFFKGDIVPFEAGSSFAGNSDRTQSNNTFEPVGMRLEVRPSITPEDRVDMEVRVELSQLKDEIVNGQPVRGSMETDTKMIVDSGETIMLGGILFQKDSLVTRKVPLLGDIPLLGMLFRHKAEIQTNNELIIFIIPEVIDDGVGMTDTIDAIMEKPLKTLDDVKETINRDFEKVGITDTDD